MLRFISLFAIYFFLLQSLFSQTKSFDNDSLVKELIDNNFSFDNDSLLKFSSLTEKQQLDLFYYMIENPYRKEASYFKLFDWYLNNFPESAYKKAAMPPFEYALTEEEKIPANLIFEHFKKIPKKIVYPYHCDFIEVSPLYLASEMEDISLILKMIDNGAEADSLTYAYWLEEYYQNGSFYFFSKYNDTSFYNEDGENVLNRIFNSKDYFYIDIPLVKSYDEAYIKLIEHSLQGNNEDIDSLWDEFLPIHLKYEASKRLNYSTNKEQYYSNKLQILLYTSLIRSDKEILKKLFELEPREVIYSMFTNPGSIKLEKEEFEKIQNDEELWTWFKGEIEQNNDPISPIFLIANNVSLENHNGNTQLYLLSGGSLEDLAKFYASDQTDSPEIFEQIANGNSRAIQDYLDANKNPFIKDKYGLSMFDLLVYSGMTEIVLQICEENRYLPLSEECLQLAIHNKDTAILEALAQKISLSDYGSDLIQEAIFYRNKEALTWLISKNISFDDCFSSFRQLLEALYLFSDTEMLEILLKAGLRNQKWEEVNEFSFFQNDFDWKYNVSLLDFALANHFDKAVELMYSYFYPDGEKPEINLLSIAAICGTPQMVSFLMSKGLSANEKDSTFENISPIEIATYVGNTDILRTMVENGADYHIKPIPGIKAKLTNDDNVFSLADIAGSYSTLEYLKSKGCIFYPEIYTQIDTYIDCWMSDKVKELMLKYPKMDVNDFMRSILSSNNKELGKWVMDNYSISIKDLIEDANLYDQNWFFEACMKNSSLKDSIDNYRDEEGNTILHIAVNELNTGIVKLLIKNGFDPNIENNKGFTPYFLALQMRGGEKMAALMKQNGAKNDFSAEAINNCFQEAINNSDIEKMMQYLKMGSDPNMQCVNYYWGQASDTIPAIFKAGKMYKETAAELLLLYGANPNTFSEDYQTPLYQALNENNYNIARLLIYKGADVNYVPKVERGYSCETQQPLIEKVKLAYVDLPLCDIESSKKDIDNEIERVVKEDKESALDKLIDYIENDGYYYDKQKIEPHLIKEGSEKLFKYALEKGIIEGKNTNQKCSLLKSLLLNKRLDLIKSLPDTFYINIDLKKLSYNDPIERAIDLGKRYFSFNSIEETIVPDKENVDISDETRKFALEALEYLIPKFNVLSDTNYFKDAVRSRFYEAVNLFMNNADLNTKERQAIVNIINKDNKALKKQLEEGLSPDADVYGFRLLSCAAWAQNLEATELLFDKGADITYSNITEDNNPYGYNRPIMWGFMLGDTSLIDFISDKGAVGSYLGFTGRSNALVMFMAHKEHRKWFNNLLQTTGLNFATGSSTSSFLSQAIIWDDADLVELLLQNPPDEETIKKYENGHYYIPKDAYTALGYAVEQSSANVFFKLLEIIDSTDITKYISRYNIQHCDSPEILSYLIDNDYPLEDNYTFDRILTKISETNNNELIYKILNKLTSNDSLIFDKYNPDLNEVKRNLFENNNLEAFKMMLDAGMKYDDNYLREAIENDNLDFIRYFLIDLKADWIIDWDYQSKFAPDYSKSYKTWLYTINLIEGLIKNEVKKEEI